MQKNDAIYRKVSDDFGGEYLGDVELGVVVMSDIQFEEVFPLTAIKYRAGLAMATADLNGVDWDAS